MSSEGSRRKPWYGRSLTELIGTFFLLTAVGFLIGGPLAGYPQVAVLFCSFGILGVACRFEERIAAGLEEPDEAAAEGEGQVPDG